MRPAKLAVTLVAVLALLLAACSAGPTRSWRDLEVTLPDGWSIGNETSTSIYLADGKMTGEPTDPGILQVGVQFSHEPSTTPSDWRRFVADQDGEIEVDETIDVGGLAATRLVFSYVTGDTPMREMVVIVPSRGVVMLFQPVPLSGELDGRERFDARRSDFEQILSSIEFGAPSRN